MNFNLDRTTWTRVRFGDVVSNVNETIRDPLAAGIDRVIAMEHLDPGELRIARWGTPEDGTTFTRRVRPGQTLFGKRRAYQRKAAYAEFDAICSGDILTFQANPAKLLPELLPFLVQSDGFYEHALGTSAGSLSPRTNWKDLATYEFDLPPLDEQHRIANLLWQIERTRRAHDALEERLWGLRSSWLHSLFVGAGDARLIELDQLIEKGRPICYGVLKPGSEVAGGPLIVDVKDYPAGAVTLETVRRCDPKIEEPYRRSRLRKGDVLLSIRGTIGRVAEVPDELDGHNISRDTARVSGDPSKVHPGFLRMVLESPDVQAAIKTATTGLAVKGINVAKIRTLKVPEWTLTEQVASYSKLKSMEMAISESATTRAALDRLRDSVSSEVFGR